MTTHSEKDLREAEKIVERIRLTKRVTMEDVIDRAAEIVATALAAARAEARKNGLRAAANLECGYCSDGRDPFEHEGGLWHDVARGHSSYRVFNPISPDCNTEPCKAYKIRRALIDKVPSSAKPAAPQRPDRG